MVAKGVPSSCAAPAASVLNEASFSWRTAERCSSNSSRSRLDSALATRDTKCTTKPAANVYASHMPCRCNADAPWCMCIACGSIGCDGSTNSEPNDNEVNAATSHARRGAKSKDASATCTK